MRAIVATKRRIGVDPSFPRLSGSDSDSCAGCHNDPVLGAGRDLVANVFVSEGFESAQFDTADPSISSERHTTSLMGAGLVESLAREMTADLHAERDGAVDGVDADLIVRPLSRKGVFTSLRRFTINALNVHHGMVASASVFLAGGKKPAKLFVNKSARGGPLRRQETFDRMAFRVC